MLSLSKKEFFRRIWRWQDRVAARAAAEAEEASVAVLAVALEEAEDAALAADTAARIDPRIITIIITAAGAFLADRDTMATDTAAAVLAVFSA